MKPVSETVIENAAWAGAAPRLSVLIPFLRDDPRRLLDALDRLGESAGGAVEIVTLDDGGDDDGLAENVADTLLALDLPARFVRLSSNLGRAKGRNRLASHARGDFLLFLDADMLPDDDGFLAAYLNLIVESAPAVVFGGFSLDQAPLCREHALHRQMALGSDCLSAQARRLNPEKHVFTSNLLVRKDVFAADPFDESFTGWGWEDVEWAMRAARRHSIGHVDNTATHLGLDTAPAMAAKYEQSAANFARVAANHPEIVAGYPSYRVAKVLKGVPWSPFWRPILKAVALSDAAPLAIRAFSMRLYRAALYAEAL